MHLPRYTICRMVSQNYEIGDDIDNNDDVNNKYDHNTDNYNDIKKKMEITATAKLQLFL